MFVQTEVTPNPNSLKFLPGKKVSNSGPYEITKKDNVKNELVRNILSVNGVEGVFLGENFISVNKNDVINWNDLKHIIISLINDFVAEEELTRSVMDLAEKISKKSADVVAIGKKAFYKQAELNLFEAYEYTSRVMVENTLNDDAKEGIESFLEKRDPNWSDS